LLDIDSRSYSHSLKVADTAVDVARKMNCNYELVNLSERFHEIGKLRGSNYVENGINILKENNFPKEVINIVREHNSKSNYPKTLESAIVMLSDSIETTLAKVMETNGYNIQHEKIISQIIDIRFDSGCLDYAIKDLEEFKKLRKAFLEE
jgi:putative nucleotidyltransferase with HDIG domain